MTALFLTASLSGHCQELFVFTEPASTQSARSVQVRVANVLTPDTLTRQTDYQLMPEIVYGVTRNLSLYATAFFSNRSRPFSFEGASLYLQYRFYTNDAVYRHLRAAAFARVSSNNGTVFHEEIETNGHNAGYQAGLIATQLLHRYALSFTTSYEHALDNGKGNRIPAAFGRNAFNYSFSAGHLLFPKQYVNYRQPGLNIMVELLGQTLPKWGRSFMDVAPSIQLIVNSQTRFDIGYKKQLYSQTLRIASDGFLIRVEHTFF